MGAGRGVSVQIFGTMRAAVGAERTGTSRTLHHECLEQSGQNFVIDLIQLSVLQLALSLIPAAVPKKCLRDIMAGFLSYVFTPRRSLHDDRLPRLFVRRAQFVTADDRDLQAGLGNPEVPLGFDRRYCRQNPLAGFVKEREHVDQQAL
jgi:hypothetical protein